MKSLSAASIWLPVIQNSVTFFGSARLREGNPHYDMARRLAARIASELGYAVMTGGGPGIMEAGNRGAKEAGGDSVGLSIELPNEQGTNQYVTDVEEFHYFFSRKVSMTFSAEAYLYFAGGFGTLDEFFEILTLVQTKKIEPVPIILVGKDFWQGLIEYAQNTLLPAGTISESDLDLITVTDDEEEILSIIKNAPIREHNEFSGNATS